MARSSQRLPTEAQLELFYAATETSSDDGGYTDSAQKAAARFLNCSLTPNSFSDDSRKTRPEEVIEFMTALQTAIDSGEYRRDAKGNIVHESINLSYIGRFATCSIIGPGIEIKSNNDDRRTRVSESWLTRAQVLDRSYIAKGSFVAGLSVVNGSYLDTCLVNEASYVGSVISVYSWFIRSSVEQPDPNRASRVEWSLFEDSFSRGIYEVEDTRVINSVVPEGIGRLSRQEVYTDQATGRISFQGVRRP